MIYNSKKVPWVTYWLQKEFPKGSTQEKKVEKLNLAITNQKQYLNGVDCYAFLLTRFLRKNLYSKLLRIFIKVLY